jgi:type VI secretion system secreted protein VgrG
MADENVMSLTSTSGKELLIRHLSASEEMGQLFEFNVHAVSDSDAIELEDLLGKPACVSLELASRKKRYFHGLVCAMGTDESDEKGFGYRLVLRPWLWLLTRRSDTRVFQGQTMEQIVRKVFQPFKTDFEFHLTGSLPTYEYCVQYRETDFNFVSRLLQQEGAYYYFKHEVGKHTMVIVNSPSAHEASAHQEKFPFRGSIASRIDLEPINHWTIHKEIQSGQVVLRDYDFVKPQLTLEAQNKASRMSASTLLEVYDYPGFYADESGGDRYAKIRMEEQQAGFMRVTGHGICRALACGNRFTLVGYPREDQNKAHVVLSTHIECALSGYESGAGKSSFHCSFIALDANETFRPKRMAPKPVVAGLHTAVVVGPAGQEIHTDAHGRIKVQFHWDRLGKKDEKSSCWVRVATPWAGNTWGMISLPRIGQEVVVDFLEGDPDRPMVIGSVYNGKNKPPYALPDNATVSTSKSRSSKDGGASNFNELRFEDKKGDEYIWLQAEKDFHQLVKNDATLQIDGSQQRLVAKDVTEKIDGDVTIKVGKDFVEEVTGSHSVKTSKDAITEASMSISNKSGTSIDIKAGTALAAVAATNVHIKGGANVVVEAGVMLTLKAGASTIVLGPSGVMVVGTMVMINSGGSGGAGDGASPKAGLTVSPPEKKTDPLK